MQAGGPSVFRRLIGLGLFRATLLVTAASVLISLFIAILVTTALGRLSAMGMAISVVIPTVLVPATWYPFFRVTVLLHAAEERLRASEEKHRSILENMSEAYLETDAEGRIAFFNDALTRISGYGREELLGRSIAEFTPPGALHGLLAAVRPRRLAGAVAEIEDFTLRARDGTERVLEASLAPLGGEAGGFRAVVRDVTERVTAARERAQYEERLRRAKRMESLGLLAGGVAHDLNNILSGLVGYPDILLLDYPDDARLRAKLTIIREAGERAAGIVRDLLTLSRREVAATEVVDFNGVVADYLRSPGHALLLRDHPDVRFATEIDPALARVVGSPVHLAKAVMNIVLNAFEAIPAAGTVVLSTANRRLDAPLAAYEEVPAGDYVSLTVADSGSGMTPEDLERVFEPFYTRKVLGRSGTGLGMAVVWGVVKDHGGYVDIRSAPGEGTSVEVFLPATARPARPEPPPDDLERLRGHGERVLVVDDRADQRTLAAEMLGRLGYRADAVPGAHEAVAALRGEPADLVLVDMIMDPGPDGLDTCRMVRELRPGQHFVLASGYSETDRVREALALGGVWFLRKPYRLDALARLVREALAARAPGAP